MCILHKWIAPVRVTVDACIVAVGESVGADRAICSAGRESRTVANHCPQSSRDPHCDTAENAAVAVADAACPQPFVFQFLSKPKKACVMTCISSVNADDKYRSM